MMGTEMISESSANFNHVPRLIGPEDFFFFDSPLKFQIIQRFFYVFKTQQDSDTPSIGALFGHSLYISVMEANYFLYFAVMIIINWHTKLEIPLSYHTSIVTFF